MDGLYYSESHEWLKVEGEFGYIGITDYAQHQLGSVVYVDLPEVDDELNQGEEFGAVESVKAASDLLSPISGTVVEINEALEDKPELLNEDAFGNSQVSVECAVAAYDEVRRADNVPGIFFLREIPVDYYYRTFAHCLQIFCSWDSCSGRTTFHA